MARPRKSGRIRQNPLGAMECQLGLAASAIDGALFTVDPRTLFKRHAPLEVELGAGSGEFVLERAASTPQHNFLAIELAESFARRVVLRAVRAGLDNLIVL